MAQEAEQKVTTSDELNNCMGKRIQVETFKGTVRYVGPVATSKKADTIWLGIEWDDENRGKHDGAVTDNDGKQHRYFQCESGKGSFIKRVKANFGRDLLTVILDRFSLDGLQDDIKEQEQIASDSSYKIEFVGWERSIKKQCNLNEKASISLEHYDCNCVDMNTLQELKKTVPKATSIDLPKNLITSIDTFCGLSIIGDTLRELNLSHNKLNHLNYKTIKSLFAQNAFTKNTFPSLQMLFLNNTASDDFNPWSFVYLLSINGCLPKLGELQICANNIKTLKLPSHIINNESEANPNDYGDDETKLCIPDGQKMAEIFHEIKVLNIGENDLSDFNEIGDVFGYLPQLRHLKMSYCKIESIVYRKGIFSNMARLWMRNNLFNDIKLFDELNNFPTLHQVNFVECTFADTLGHSTIRDFSIGKMAELHVCNSSLVSTKERHDAELFYLKWIMKQVATKNNDNNENDNDNDDESKDEEAEKQRIEKLYPRYIELTTKHGAMNFNKKETAKLMAVNVIIKSMDPESITAKNVEKKLPTTMTVSQLKLLCKRLFKLNPQHQRLMYREKGSQSFPDDMSDDSKPLSFYNIKDGTEILMQSSNFDKK